MLLVRVPSAGETTAGASGTGAAAGCVMDEFAPSYASMVAIPPPWVMPEAWWRKYST